MPSSVERHTSDDPNDSRNANLAWLWILAGLIGALLGVVAIFSHQFEYTLPKAERPVLIVVVLLISATALYLVAVWRAIRVREGRELTQVVWIPALLFRLVLLPTEPIQEVDLYRYMWDGSSLCTGVSPFRYSPQQVLEADADIEMRGDLRRLVELSDTYDAKRMILERVHFAELRTVYPPVSQFFFAIAMAITPNDASVRIHRLVMKSILVAMDVLTLACVWVLLSRIGIHRGWAIVYAWCPLLLKEIANSGHLDAIVVALTTFAVFMLVVSTSNANRMHLAVSVVFLALATAAKLYPVVLLPLWFQVAWVRWRFSTAALAAGSFVLLSSLLMWPMLDPTKPATIHATAVARSVADPPLPESEATIKQMESEVSDEAMPIPIPPADRELEIAPSGLTAFLSRWEMNDLIFLVILENIRPNRMGVEPAWFVVVNDSYRIRLAGLTARLLGIEPQPAAFLLARGMTLGIAALIALIAARSIRIDDPRTIVAAAGLTIAWFFLLSPTLNPWYWLWVLPFVAALRNRVWLIVPGILLVYYLRFWCDYDQAGLQWGASSVSGTALFDRVIVFLEWIPFFVLLAVSTIWAKGRR